MITIMYLKQVLKKDKKLEILFLVYRLCRILKQLNVSLVKILFNAAYFIKYRMRSKT